MSKKRRSFESLFEELAEQAAVYARSVNPDFNQSEYMRIYWFWLGDTENQVLRDQISQRRYSTNFTLVRRLEDRVESDKNWKRGGSYSMSSDAYPQPPNTTETLLPSTQQEHFEAVARQKQWVKEHAQLKVQKSDRARSSKARIAPRKPRRRKR